jgi:DNA polymerase-3 subunit gamma/tau
MGKALYREYRPKSLDEVVGQEHITNTLQNAIKKGAISHAYLLTGQRGTGKTSVARILAHEINDLAYNEAETHLDIIEIDAASNRRIDEIRDLRDKVHIAPTSAKYKVYIIDEVHMLTREAFNALLKTLEEPPEHAIFILATTEVHKVPDTILSRTQRFTFKPIDQAKVMSHLKTIAEKEGLEVDSHALQLLADHGKGSFRDSISMLDQIAGLGEKKITGSSISGLLGIPHTDVIQQLVEATFSNASEQVFDCTQRLREQGAHAATTARSLIEYLRSQIMDHSAANPAQAVQLMKELLPLTGATSTFEAIEIALLDVMQFSQTATNTASSTQSNKDENVVSLQASVHKTSQPVQKPHPEAIPKEVMEKNTAEPKQSKTEPQEKQEVPNKSDLQPSSWNDVLQEVKENYATLYGVLRMAEMSTSEDTITLVFQFDFHKKKVNQPENMKKLTDVITAKLGREHKLELVVKRQTEAPASLKQPQKDVDLTSVSNIFGGAELLE